MSNFNNTQTQQLKVYKVDLNGKEKPVDTVSKTTTDNNGNICFNYALLKANKYIIKVYCNSLTSGTYTFTAEQDNWVYAPNGGVSVRQDYYASDLKSGSHAMSVYLTNKQFQEIVDTNLSKIYSHGYEYNWNEILLSKNDPGIINTTKEAIGHFYENFGYNEILSKQISDIYGNTSNATSIALIFVEPAVSTPAGIFLACLSIGISLNNFEQDQVTTMFAKKILNTDLNVVVNIPCNPTYRGAITTLDGWENYHYINRYAYSERTLVYADTVILSYKDKGFKELSLTDK